MGNYQARDFDIGERNKISSWSLCIITPLHLLTPEMKMKPNPDQEGFIESLTVGHESKIQEGPLSQKPSLSALMKKLCLNIEIFRIFKGNTGTGCFLQIFIQILVKKDKVMIKPNSHLDRIASLPKIDGRTGTFYKTGIYYDMSERQLNDRKIVPTRI